MLPATLIMLDAIAWFALGVAATLVTAYVAHRIGRIQISFMRRAHQLNENLATPKIGTWLKLERRQPNANRADVIRYFLLTTLYNDADPAAQKIDGNWTLSCSDSGQDRTIPIYRDSLGNIPYDLEAQELRGNAITNTINSGQVTINVDIDFTYIGLTPDKAERYTAKYQYDSQQKQMVRIGE